RVTLDVHVHDGVDAVVADDAVEGDRVQQDVARLVEGRAVDDGGDVAGDAGAAGGALAELGALAGFQLDDVGLGHLSDSLKSWGSGVDHLARVPGGPSSRLVGASGCGGRGAWGVVPGCMRRVDSGAFAAVVFASASYGHPRLAITREMIPDGCAGAKSRGSLVACRRAGARVAGCLPTGRGPGPPAHGGAWRSSGAGARSGTAWCGSRRPRFR